MPRQRSLERKTPAEVATLLIEGRLAASDVPEKHWSFLARGSYLERKGAEIGAQKAREIQRIMREL